VSATRKAKKKNEKKEKQRDGGRGRALVERDFLELRREKSAADRIGAGFIKVFIGGRAADERSTAAIKKKKWMEPKTKEEQHFTHLND